MSIRVERKVLGRGARFGGDGAQTTHKNQWMGYYRSSLVRIINFVNAVGTSDRGVLLTV